jgi:hypothetical protein
MDLFDENGCFTWPRSLPSLEGVPDEIAGGYEPDGDGFRLHPDVAAEVEACEATMAEMQAAHDAEMAEIKESSAKLRAHADEVVKIRQIRDALIVGGVKPGLVNGAAKYLLGTLAIDVAETDDGGVEVTVAGVYGPVSVSHAVESWLQTPEGEAYMPERPSPDAGRYSQQIAALKRTLH